MVGMVFLKYVSSSLQWYRKERTKHGGKRYHSGTTTISTVVFGVATATEP
jgi:hypothetical protein